MTDRADVVVIGGGLVGLATAYQLLRSRPGTRVVVLEKEPEPARHQSGRNSGVLHSGLYYAPGSWRALACRRAKEQLEAFADEHGVARRRCGKLVVAIEPAELPRLETLRERGEANGLRGLAMLSPGGWSELEPEVGGLRALHVPETGVIDFAGVARAFAREIAAAGGELRTGTEVLGLEPSGNRQLVLTSGADLLAGGVVSCAGLRSDRVAAMSGDRDARRIVPFRGAYLRLRPRAAARVRALVYPVPAQGLPFLGVHLTRRIDDQVWAGPNATLAFAREGYARFSFDARDLRDALAFPGLWRLAFRHPRETVEEYARDASRAATARAIGRYLPGVTADDLEPAPAGNRAQLLDADGTLVDDFLLQEAPGAIHVRNAPSPAATACLAIGEVVAGRAVARFLDGRG
ncbi:MAG: L-2-hydroxyglutarate oxidase [Planctomycetaceae bacterium]